MNSVKSGYYQVIRCARLSQITVIGHNLDESLFQSFTERINVLTKLQKNKIHISIVKHVEYTIQKEAPDDVLNAFVIDNN